MTDKDASERNTIKNYFLNASLILCYFHVVKAFEVVASRRSHRIDFDYPKKYINCEKVNDVVKIHISELIRKGEKEVKIILLSS